MLSSQRDEMRGNQCAINSPRFTATSSRGLFQPPLLASSRAFKARPASPSDSTSDCPTAILLAKNYFNLLSYPPPPPAPSSSRTFLPRHHLSPTVPPPVRSRRQARTRGPDLLALFRGIFFRPKRAVIYGDASINVATRGRFEY